MTEKRCTCKISRRQGLDTSTDIGSLYTLGTQDTRRHPGNVTVIANYQYSPSSKLGNLVRAEQALQLNPRVLELGSVEEWASCIARGRGKRHIDGSWERPLYEVDALPEINDRDIHLRHDLVCSELRHLRAWTQGL